MNDMEASRILISFSGGRTSAYMASWMLNFYKAEWNNVLKCFIGQGEKGNAIHLITVFANTGKERPETLDFVNKCDQYFNLHLNWVEAITNPRPGRGVRAKRVNFDTASRNGEPFEAMIKKHGIPNQSTPHCTRELKKYAIRDFAKRFAGWKNYLTAIGIRKDEPKRLDWEKAKREKLIYPLALDYPCTKFDINGFWLFQPFDLELKSYEGNCDNCWKKSLRKLLTLAVERPSSFDWWREMQDKYSNYLPDSRQHNPNIKPPFLFYRGNTTVEEILEESKFPFEPAKDESKTIDAVLALQVWDNFLDENEGCVESCEVF